MSKKLRSPYEGFKGWKRCPDCKGAGLLDRKDFRKLTPYEPIGVKKCRRCGVIGRIEK